MLTKWKLQNKNKYNFFKFILLTKQKSSLIIGMTQKKLNWRQNRLIPEFTSITKIMGNKFQYRIIFLHRRSPVTRGNNILMNLGELIRSYSGWQVRKTIDSFWTFHGLKHLWVNFDEFLFIWRSKIVHKSTLRRSCAQDPAGELIALPRPLNWWDGLADRLQEPNPHSGLRSLFALPWKKILRAPMIVRHVCIYPLTICSPPVRARLRLS